MHDICAARPVSGSGDKGGVDFRAGLKRESSRVEPQERAPLLIMDGV